VNGAIPNGEERAKLIERVHKLLTLAEGTNNEHEAGVAAAKATELVQTYNLAQHELEKSGQKKAQPIGYAHVTLHTNDGKVLPVRKDWVVNLVSAVCRANFCEPRYGKRHVVIYGRQEEASLAAYMLDNLTAQLERLAWRRGEEYARMYFQENGLYPRQVAGRDNIHVWKASWMLGAVAVVTQKLAAQHQKFQQESSTGMELVISRGDELDEYFRQVAEIMTQATGKKPKDKHFSAGTSTYNGSAFAKGMADGKDISVQAGVAGPGQNKRLGS
jgi:hypothetical protein